MKEIDILQLPKSIFELIGKDWMLIGAKDSGGRVNAMTASWGGMGVLWGKNVAFVFVRPQRFTRQLIDDASTMSISFFGEEYRKMLNYMGKASGKNEDKIEKSNLDVEIVDGAPVFAQSNMTMVCKKMYCQQLDPKCFVDKKVESKWYILKDFHYMYVVEIEKILQNN
ncbi:MAG: flavin reductase [Clostridia bacterium]